VSRGRTWPSGSRNSRPWAGRMSTPTLPYRLSSVHPSLKWVRPSADLRASATSSRLRAEMGTHAALSSPTYADLGTPGSQCCLSPAPALCAELGTLSVHFTYEEPAWPATLKWVRPTPQTHLAAPWRPPAQKWVRTQHHWHTSPRHGCSTRSALVSRAETGTQSAPFTYEKPPLWLTLNRVRFPRAAHLNSR